MSTPQTQFDALVQAYHALLYRYALWLCGNAAQSEDLVQETFLRAWKSLHRLREPAAAKAWLLTILRREFLRGTRRRCVVTRSLDTLDANHTALMDTRPALVDELSDRSRLHTALLRLPLEQREPLLLQILGGYRCEEIAAELGVSSGAIMTRLSRARLRLRQLLADEHDIGTNPATDKGVV
ncbi:MAG TPA: sigma-70 family RNA polymerase sigma factor [Gammaproteobacteria bacterium]|nr:sigma-70 family RNA polymerase sigma factor [Gammaproteobacteria bacterium]